MKRGELVSYEYPTSAMVKEKKWWKITFKNAGDENAYIFGGILNKTGNPGDMIVYHGDKSYTLKPGERFIVWAYLAPGVAIGPGGYVAFLAEGDYTSQIQAGHRGDSEWVVDDYREVG